MQQKNRMLAMRISEIDLALIRAKASHVCTIHHIREEVLYQLVLEDIQRVSELASRYEGKFVELLTASSQKARRAETVKLQRELGKIQKRIAELNGLFRKVYEDNYSGKLTDERFVMLSNGYDEEQRGLKTREQALRESLDEQTAQSENTGKFLAIVEKYTDIREITPPVLHELIEKIVIHEADRSTGKRVQQVDIHYNFVGMVPAGDEADSQIIA